MSSAVFLALTFVFVESTIQQVGADAECSVKAVLASPQASRAQTTKLEADLAQAQAA